MMHATDLRLMRYILAASGWFQARCRWASTCGTGAGENAGHAGISCHAGGLRDDGIQTGGMNAGMQSKN